MKIPLSWISRFADISDVRVHTPDVELAHTYSIRTAEIDEIIASPIPTSVVVARVLSVTKHPDSEKLNVVLVDAGEGVARQIVCGAPNVRDAKFVPAALPGSALPGDRTIGETVLRGVESRGMLCAIDELALADERAAGVWALEDTWSEETLSAMIGKPFATLRLPVPALPEETDASVPMGDTVFEIDNKFITNRPDLFSVAGNAREFATIFKLPLREYTPAPLPECAPLSATVETEHVFAYHLLAFDNVPSRASGFDGVSLLLRQSGLATKFTHVDVTNAIMTELGQPMHAFDRDKLVGDIRVRMAREGETIEALDGKTYTLTAADIVIADAEGAVAIGGIMGGARTAVGNDTVRVVYESGCFDPVVVRKTSTRLGLRTDALMRYEKSLDPLLAAAALPRILDYLRYYGYDATPVGKFSHFAPASVRTVEVVCTHAFLETKIGAELDPEEVTDILSRLGFKIARTDDGYRIGVPSWRATKDVDIQEDIAEEVARIHGYDRIEAVPLSGVLTPVPVDASLSAARLARSFFSGRGVFEIVTRSFSYPARETALGYDDEGAGAIRVVNAYSEEASLMRRTMIGGLLEAVRDNVRAHSKFACFEVGKVYSKGEKFTESKKIAGIFTGMELAEVRILLDDFVAAMLPTVGVSLESEAPGIARFAHPGKSGRYATGHETILEFASLHPALAKRFEAPADTYYFEADIATLVRLRAGTGYRYSPLDRFPGIERELNFVMDARESAGNIANRLAGAHPLVRHVHVTDVYEDAERLGADKKSVTFNVLIRDREKTVTDAEAMEIQTLLVSSVSSDRIALRS
jgi:phenylalanyl-tRNA synthetase beta chain